MNSTIWLRISIIKRLFCSFSYICSATRFSSSACLAELSSVFSTLLWTIFASKGRLIKSVTPISSAWDILSEFVSAEIIITGTVSIHLRRFITSSTSRPSIMGITMSSIIRDISPARFCSSLTAIRPFSTSMVSYSSPSISTKMERFISESSTIKIFCLRFLPSIPA